jgi:hypothetical protein
MQRVVPDVGVENTAAHFLLGDALDEPGFLDAITREPRTHLLLDLHNVWAMAHNLEFDPYAYLARFPLHRVIEIHIAGGAWSDPRWLATGKSLRLDGHDDAVPDEVFALLDHVLPDCTSLRGITLERMEGSVTEADIPLLRDEIARIRHMFGNRVGVRMFGNRVGVRKSGRRARSRTSRSIAHALRRDDPFVVSKPQRGTRASVSTDGFRMSALLVARLRFERLLNGSDEASREFRDDPAGFTTRFREYHRATPMHAIFPSAEARLWLAWRARNQY